MAKKSKITFEAGVRSCVDGLEALLGPKAAPSGTSPRPARFTEFLLGFEQDRYFVGWLQEDGERRRPAAAPELEHRTRPARLELPALVPSWEEGLDAWSDHWRPILANLHLLAGGLALHAVVRSNPGGLFLPSCRFSLTRDVESEDAPRCDQLLDGIDALPADGVAAGLGACFARPLTRTWFDRIAAMPEDLTLEGIERSKPDLESMLAGAKRIAPRPPSPLEIAIREHLQRRR